VFLIFWKFETLKIALLIFFFYKCQKLNEGKKGLDFSSNIDYAKKSMTKVMNHRIERLSSLLDSKQTQLNVTNINEISIESPNVINEAYENNSCSSIVKTNQLFLPKSKRPKVNSPTKEHQCDMCKKRFIFLSQLKIHKRIHSKETPFSCDQCQMSFYTKGNLKLHRRIHTGKKLYSCDLCPKKFARSNDLTRHKRMHTGERPYQCDLCPKKFARSHHLKIHNRIHAGERPYSRDLCPKNFAQSYDLTNHKRIHS
jgi:uncharacterized Zn-finger protein